MALTLSSEFAFAQGRLLGRHSAGAPAPAPQGARILRSIPAIPPQQASAATESSALPLILPPSGAASRRSSWRAMTSPLDTAEAAGEEDSKFVELQPELEAYGPPVLLLLGVSPEDKASIRAAMERSGADFITVCTVTRAMMDGMSLWDAMQAAASSHDGGDGSDAAPTPQVLVPTSISAGSRGAEAAGVGLCIMSGLTGEECMLLVEMVQEELAHLGDHELAFAAMRPKFAQRMLRDVVSDILGDHQDNML